MENHITNYNGSQTYSYEDLDKNRDGKIDSITVIYKNTTQNIVINRSDPLWNYKDYADYVEINLGDGRMLQSQYYVQVINNYSTLYMANNDQKPIVSLKSPIHEMGHIFGLLDLYNSVKVKRRFISCLPWQMPSHLFHRDFRSKKKRLWDGQTIVL